MEHGSYVIKVGTAVSCQFTTASTKKVTHEKQHDNALDRQMINLHVSELRSPDVDLDRDEHMFTDSADMTLADAWARCNGKLLNLCA
jgi:hypothetical protein